MIGLSGQGMQGHAVIPDLENSAILACHDRLRQGIETRGRAGGPQKVLAAIRQLAAEPRSRGLSCAGR